MERKKDCTTDDDQIDIKYWKQRYILFSRFDDGIMMDNESWFSVTPEPIARHIAQRIANVMKNRRKGRLTVIDPFCGAGGNVIQFALQPAIKMVTAIDIDPNKISMARHNASIYGCEHKIRFITGDFFQVIKDGQFKNKVDACFYSSPWGGPNYLNFEKYSLRFMQPDGFKILEHASKYITKNLVLFLPRNFDYNELETMANIVYNMDPPTTKKLQKVELECNQLILPNGQTKVKSITAYFGETIVEPRRNSF